MIDRAVMLTGTNEPTPDRRVLTAGPLSATLENGALRWIRFGDAEVIRGIAFLVRDRSWGTPSPELTDVTIVENTQGFRVTFDARCRTDDGDLPWSAEIVGEADGTIRFIGTAMPAQDFLTNRTGFVILHPLEGVAGCSVEVAHGDGTKRRARFPALVDPEPCFFDIRGLAHEVAPGVWASVTMEGDAWEMEDHRNWLDASFKTYVRPLALPHPYTLKAGEVVTQSVILRVKGTLPKLSPRRSMDAPAEIALGRAAAARFPAIGLRAPVPWLDAAENAADHARAVRPQLLNGRIDPRLGEGGDALARFGALAAEIGAGLMLELIVPCRRDPADEIAAFAAELRRTSIHPESIALAVAEDKIRQEPGAPPPPLALLAEVYRAARLAFPTATIGGGTFSFFTELNRNWPPIGLIDYVTHMVSSVVHAADDATMMENLESIRHICRTVQAFAGKMPHRVVASTIGLETGAGGTPALNPENARRAMSGEDPRHRGLFGAAWTLAAIGEWARGGAAGVTPAALAGPFGIATAEGTLHPIYHVVAGMAEAAGHRMMEAFSSDRRRIAALAHATAEQGVALWLANLTDIAQSVRLPAPGRAVRLDETTFAAAARDPQFLRSGASALAANTIEIGAYGVVKIDIGR